VRFRGGSTSSMYILLVIGCSMLSCIVRLVVLIVSTCRLLVLVRVGVLLLVYIYYRCPLSTDYREVRIILYVMLVLICYILW
jgi:hypothetical protein